MRLAQLTAQPLVWLVRGYQIVLSPMSLPSCRYFPSCSAYAVAALNRHGVFRGIWLATRRVVRCNPWSKGGVDHVPPLAGQRDDGELIARHIPT